MSEQPISQYVRHTDGSDDKWIKETLFPQLLSKDAKRELELVLLGASFSKDFREQVTQAVSSGSVSDSIATVIDGIVSYKPEVVKAWLAQRSVTAGEGERVVAAIIRTLEESHQRNEARDTVARLHLASKVMPPADFYNETVKALSHLVSLRNSPIQSETHTNESE